MNLIGKAFLVFGITFFGRKGGPGCSYFYARRFRFRFRFDPQGYERELRQGPAGLGKRFGLGPAGLELSAE